MTVLILGANGSGKSVYAERLAAKLSCGALYYVATMIPYGEDGRARVEKHRAQRETLAFSTVEQPSSVSAIPFPPDSVVLLEDVSNLLGNAMFTGKGGDENGVFADINAMCEACRASVLVSIDGLTAGPEYDGETCAYIDALNRLNQRLSVFADVVVAMHDGQPFCRKGDVHALD